MISAPKLESIVWDAIVNAIQNPDVIVEQVKKSEDKQKEQPAKTKQEIKAIEKELRRLGLEEGRVFEAYKKEVITLEQLGVEMGKLNHEKERFGRELKELETEKASQFPRKETVRSIREYCQIFKDRLDQFTSGQKQSFLRLLLDKIIIEGKKVRIQGLIPVYTQPQEIENLRRSLQFNNIGVSTFACNTNLVPAFGNIALQTLINGVSRRRQFPKFFWLFFGP